VETHAGYKYKSSSLRYHTCSVSVTTTVFEKTTPNFSPSLSLVGQKPFLTASPSTSLRGIGLFPPCLRPLHRAHPSLKGGGARRSLGHLPLQVALRSSQVLKPSPPMPLAGRQLPCLRLPPPQPGLAPPFSRDRHPHRLNEHAAALPPPCLRSQLRSWLEPIPTPATFSTFLSRSP